MTSSSFDYWVSLYLKGDELDPSIVSAALLATPSESHFKGEKWTTASGRVVVERTGLWVLTERSSSGELAPVLQLLLNRIDHAVGLMDVDTVSEAFIDVFVGVDARDDGGGSFEFELGPQELNHLSRLGVPVRIKVDVVPK